MYCIISLADSQFPVLWSRTGSLLCGDDELASYWASLYHSINFTGLQNISTMESENPPKLLYLPYVKGVNEQNEMCQPLGVRTVMKTASTRRSWLVKVKQAILNSNKKGVIYKVPCKDCPCEYIGETGRTLEKHLSEHKTAVKKFDPKNGIAVHAWTNQVNWEAVSVKQEERSSWKRAPFTFANSIRRRIWTVDSTSTPRGSPCWTSLPPPSDPLTPNQNTPPSWLLCTPSDFIYCNYSIHSLTQL